MSEVIQALRHTAVIAERVADLTARPPRDLAEKEAVWQLTTSFPIKQLRGSADSVLNVRGKANAVGRAASQSQWERVHTLAGELAALTDALTENDTPSAATGREDSQ